METAVQIVRIVGGLIAFFAFFTGFAAHGVLQFSIDRRRGKAETGQPGWKAFGSILASADCYKEEARVFWVIRDKALKTFAISAGVFALLAVAAAIFDVPLK